MSINKVYQLIKLNKDCNMNFNNKTRKEQHGQERTECYQKMA